MRWPDGEDECEVREERSMENQREWIKLQAEMEAVQAESAGNRKSNQSWNGAENGDRERRE